MARKTKKRQVVETPSQRFERVVERAFNRQRRAKLRKADQAREKSVTAPR